ncbi:glycine dehydrogenase [Wolfiporia cocos MD-104 SS10]|uniref:Glycine cleavage system H protein n=1 Tax=Wolfiporia cocos (strain MD-104) TaxID=742152 RepID=A0A2H3IUZ6_WOLCO|nr:glycine dehydrogenase [Wolfiporia cocos MD-104 SS10]
MFSALRQVSRPATYAVRAARRPTPSVGVFRTAPFVRTLRFTEDHEAVVFDDSTMTGTVYITNYAQSSLGDVVFVELPAEGNKVTKGDQIGAVESVKAASDIYAPVSGTVTEVNAGLADQPGLLNKSPEDQGWLCKIKVENPAEIEALLTEEAYKAHCEH